MRAKQDAEQVVADYLAELLTPAVAPPVVPETRGAVVAIETWRNAPSQPTGPRVDDRYLLCIAAGVKLAVPMAEVSHVLPIPPLSPPNVPNPICLGRWRHPGGEARVADLAAILSPDMAGALASTLVLLGERGWALACIVVDEPVELHTDAIHWRHGATTRPWLAGMSQDPKCGVVDTIALIEWLEKELDP
ncbi:chemotaxis protein CheW [Xanthomonas sp. NCPPB 2632]|jgi:hypothetical protein|uniref:chemotaxis protein CheW n=1 Tax=Xanthomonas sp. NCPPB 2632 TaxID=3240912 RepID=UPI003513B864